MFVINLNEARTRIEVHNDEEHPSALVAAGEMAVDAPDRTVLILFHRLAIAADDHQQLNRFLDTVTSHIGSLYQALVCMRFPRTFDNGIDFGKLQFRNEYPDFMAATMDQLKYYPGTNLSDRADQYALITDRESIFSYAEQLRMLMNREAFWSTKWDLTEIRNRINSATANAMILDRVNQHPCAFGRIFLLTTADEAFGYLSDIAVDSAHQSKGLGKIIVNCLLGNVLDPAVERLSRNCSLCLQCAKEGSGTISAIKLYRRYGFELLDVLGNRMTIFLKKTSTPQHLEAP